MELYASPLRRAGATAAVRACFAALVFVAARPARAEPWFDMGENAAEDRFVDGEFDEDDHLAVRAGGHVSSGDVHDESWIALSGYRRSFSTGKVDVGGMVVVGLALDRVGRGPPPRLHAPRPLGPGSPYTPPRAASDVDAPPGALPPVGGGLASDASAVPAEASNGAAASTSPMGSTLARDCVAAALAASGLGVDDERLDAIVARSRASAALPEMRMRGMRLWQDASRATTLASADGTTFYDAIGANLVLELRLTWRLDRLLYAGDEPTIERVRLERFDARTHLATRTLEALFAWNRAVTQAQGAVVGSPGEADARLRAAEAAATLDVLTGGWFTSRGRRRGPA